MEGVLSIVLRTAVEHVDDVVVRPGRQAAMREHGVGIGAAAAVEVDAVAHIGAQWPVVARSDRGQLIEDEPVRAAGRVRDVAQDQGVTAQRFWMQVESIVVTLASHQQTGGEHRAQQVKTRAGIGGVAAGVNTGVVIGIAMVDAQRHAVSHGRDAIRIGRQRRARGNQHVIAGQQGDARGGLDIGPALDSQVFIGV